MEAKLAVSVVWHQFNPKTNVAYLLSYQPSTAQKSPPTEQKSVQEAHNLYTLRGFSLSGVKKPEQLFEVKDLPMHFIRPTSDSNSASRPPYKHLIPGDTSFANLGFDKRLYMSDQICE